MKTHYFNTAFSHPSSLQGDSNGEYFESVERVIFCRKRIKIARIGCLKDKFGGLLK
jgi:hypothetical protein